MTKRLAVAAYLMALLIGAQAATQTVAHRLDHAPALGPRVRIGPWRIYPPWAWLEWRWRFPHNKAAFLPGLFVFLAVALLGMGAIAATVQRAPRVDPIGRGYWARLADMRRAGLLTGKGTVVGRYRGRLLTFDGPEHELIAGATRSGKGVSKVIPSLLAWTGSAVVYDPKGELWQATAGFRSRFSHCVFFCPLRNDSLRYNPLLEVRKGPHEIADAQNIADLLVNVDGAKSRFDIWDQHAAQFLTAVILHVLYTEPDDRKHLGVVRELVLDAHNGLPLMVRTPHRVNPVTGRREAHPEVARVARELIQQAPKFAAGVRATAAGFLTLFADPIVVRNVSVSDMVVGDMMCAARPVTLYLQAPPSDADRLRPLMRLLIQQICRGLMGSIDADHLGRPKAHRLLLMLDEFASLGRLEFFVTNLRQMAGYQIKCALVVQSLNDLSERYGVNNTIIDNCHVITSFACADTLTAQRVSQMTGTAVEYRRSFSRRRRFGLTAADSVSLSEQVRPLLQPGDIRRLGSDEQLVFVTGFPPMRTGKARYYADCEFKARIVPAPSQAERLDSPVAPEALGAPHDWRGERPKGDLLDVDEPLATAGDDEDWQATFSTGEAQRYRGDDYAL